VRKRLTYFILLSLLITSCDLLSTRDPETPDAGRSSFIPATTPDLLFTNLTNSFKEKVVENYVGCFVDPSFLNNNYLYIPSAGSGIQFDVFLDWNVYSERQYFNNVQAATTENSPIVLQLLNEISNIAGDSAIYQYEYVLSVPFQEESELYKGNCKFHIRNDSRSQWVITRWEDIKDQEYPSWSELKGQYY
jgi:hypothetical protein